MDNFFTPKQDILQELEDGRMVKVAAAGVPIAKIVAEQAGLIQLEQVGTDWTSPGALMAEGQAKGGQVGPSETKETPKKTKTATGPSSVKASEGWPEPVPPIVLPYKPAAGPGVGLLGVMPMPAALQGRPGQLVAGGSLVQPMQVGPGQSSPAASGAQGSPGMPAALPALPGAMMGGGSLTSASVMQTPGGLIQQPGVVAGQAEVQPVVGGMLGSDGQPIAGSGFGPILGEGLEGVGTVASEVQTSTGGAEGAGSAEGTPPAPPATGSGSASSSSSSSKKGTGKNSDK